jgi:hypothetical protein
MIEIAGVEGALAPPRLDTADAPRRRASSLERSCVAVLRAGWSALTVVADDAAAARPLAAALVEVARTFRLGAVRALEADGAGAAEVAQLVDELAAARQAGGRALVTVDHPLVNPAGAPLLVAADAVVLAVRLGVSRFDAVRHSIALAGRERVLGCVIVR